MTDTGNFQQIKAIEAVLFDYTTVLDKKDYAGLANVFIEDAVVEYIGIADCNGLAEIQGLVGSILDKCAETQHMLSNVIINVNGDTAEARCYLQAMHMGKGEYEGQIMMVWGEYIDQLVLSNGQWRISKRQLKSLGTQGDIGLR